MDEIDDAQEALNNLIREEMLLNMNEVDVATLQLNAVEALENDTPDIFDIEAEVIEDEPEQAEAALAERDLDTEQWDEQVEAEANPEPNDGDVRDAEGWRQIFQNGQWRNTAIITDTVPSEGSGRIHNGSAEIYRSGIWVIAGSPEGTPTPEGTPMFDGEALSARLNDLTATPNDEGGSYTPDSPSDPMYISGIDPIDDNSSNSTVTFTTTHTEGEPFTFVDGELVQQPTVSVETSKVESSDFDENGYLTIKQIKESLTPILEDLYPDRWDWNEVDEIIVHFPKITITNSKNERHEIRDLYTRIKYSHVNKTFNSNISGARFSVTSTEMNSKYSHSHLPSISRTSIGSFKGFCLGSSTLNYLLSDLSTTPMTESSLEDLKLKFMLSMMEVENYLHWESIEGGPYNYMANISSGELRSMRSNHAMDYAELIMRHAIWGRIQTRLYTPRMKFNHKGLLEVLNNDAFLVEVSSQCEDEHLVYRDGTGKFFTTQDSSDNLPVGRIESSSHKLNFRGVEIRPKIIEEKIIYEQSGKDFAHPKIVEGCKRIIESAVNKGWTEELEGKIISHYNSRTRKAKNTSKSIFATLENVRDSIES